jgi:hypothetical protein
MLAAVDVSLKRTHLFNRSEGTPGADRGGIEPGMDGDSKGRA